MKRAVKGRYRAGRRIGLALIVASLACLILLSFVSSASGPPLMVHFIDVGQGDSCWLRLPNGDDVLIDGGKPQAGPTVVAYLQSHGVTDIELMVATHGDADHIGGLLDVLEAMPVDVAWLDSQTCTTQTCQDFCQSLSAHDVVTAMVRMGESYAWSAITALALNPSEPLYSDKNENSIVLRVSYWGIDFLLTGDAETGTEGRMQHSGLPLDAEILKVGHHGSNSSSSAAFLSAVSPQEAIISVGPNSYGHPRPEVLQRLAEVGATIWRTDEVGTVVVWTDGITYAFGDELHSRAEAAFLPLIMLDSGIPRPTRTPTATMTVTGTATCTSTPTATPSPTETQSPPADVQVVGGAHSLTRQGRTTTT